MKSLILVMGVLLLGTQCFADDTVLWSCGKGNNSNAVTVILDSISSESPYVVQISDPQIIMTLGFGGALFMSHAKEITVDGALSYEAVPAEYASGVDFTFENGGVKLIRASSTNDGIRREPNLNWWFNPGECVGANN